MNTNILIIGFGNPLRRDDGVGCRVIEQLKATLQHPSLRYVTCQELTPDLAEPISQAGHVIYVDADCEIAPGTIERRKVEPCTETELGMGHDIKPCTLLALARILYGWTPPGDLFAIGGQDFEHGEGLTAEVTKAQAEAVSQITDYVEQIMAGFPAAE